MGGCQGARVDKLAWEGRSKVMAKTRGSDGQEAGQSEQHARANGGLRTGTRGGRGGPWAASPSSLSAT